MATAFHPEQTGDARLHDLFLRRVPAATGRLSPAGGWVLRRHPATVG